MADNFWRNKKIIVTGANGFLASHITLALLKKKAVVVGIIKDEIPLSYLNLELGKRGYKNLQIKKGDIANYGFIKNLFRNFRPDICFHLAAQAIVECANKSPIPTFKTNIQGTWNILDVAREYSAHTKIVVASSDKAYGEHEKLPYTEDASLMALHPYDASKACTDILARTYAHTYNLAVGVTRCANIYGPGDLNFSRIMPETIRAVILDRDPIIRSDGRPLRDYIFIEDVVNAYLTFAKALYQHKNRFSGEAFNFGSGRPISVLKLVNMIINIAGRKNLRPKILSRTKIKGEIGRQYLSSKKANKMLHWKPRYNLRDGIKITLNWYNKFIKEKKNA